MNTSLSAKTLYIHLCLWQEFLIHLTRSLIAITQFSTVIYKLHLHSLHTVLTGWSISLLWQNAGSVSGKIPPCSPLSFLYREDKLTSWRFWVTLQLIHKVPFFKILYGQFDLFSYPYCKKDFRKINLFFSPTDVFFLALPHHWGLTAEKLSLRQGGQIVWQNQQICIWAIQAVLEAGWLIEQYSLGILQRQENLTVRQIYFI